VCGPTSFREREREMERKTTEAKKKIAFFPNEKPNRSGTLRGRRRNNGRDRLGTGSGNGNGSGGGGGGGGGGTGNGNGTSLSLDAR